MDPNKFTGERPGWGEGFDYDFARHVAAYRFASTLSAGKRVLDAGCGEGFGTQIIADVAKEVVGVDYSDQAISECRRLWSKPNLRFQQVDLTRPGSFTDTFDVVLNFQVIEHIADPLPFLRGLHARLAPEGVLIMTTPNRLRTVSENPYHVREYTGPELHSLLAGVFGRVEMQGMHGNQKVEEFEAGRARAVRNILRLDPLGVRNMLPRSVVNFAFARLAKVVRRQARPQGAAEIVPEDFFVRADSIDRALDLVALCRR
ncbi:MAG TPA: class I SAM-dependent methyltransferase [Candidatus Limnocylindrales bacterium]|nr:class I SAM-dependent methyltransferase [Candidatus Limnocylindrales bacterium]